MWSILRDGWKVIALTLIAGSMTGLYIAYRTWAVNESTSELCRRIDSLSNAIAKSYADEAVHLAQPGAPFAAYLKKHPAELTAKRVELNAKIVRVGSVACSPDKIVPPPPITIN